MFTLGPPHWYTAAAPAPSDSGPIILANDPGSTSNVNAYAYSADGVTFTGGGTINGLGNPNPRAIGSDTNRVVVSDGPNGNLYTTDGVLFFGGITGATGMLRAKVNGGTWVGAGGTKIYRSTNSGMTWSNPTNPSGATTTDVAYCAGVWYIVCANKTVMKSTDDGQTWSTVATNIGSLNVASLSAAAAMGSTLYVPCYAGASGPPWTGLISSSDGATWSVEIAATTTSQFDAVATSATSVIAVKHLSNTLYRFNSGSWTTPSLAAPDAGGSGFFCAVYRKNKFIVGHTNGDIYTSSDDGATWTKNSSLWGNADPWISAA